MKKIVFILQGIYNGGTEIALYNLVSNLDTTLYKIYVSYIDFKNSDKMMLNKIGLYATYIDLQKDSLEADVAIYTTSIDDLDAYNLIQSNLTANLNYFWFHYFCEEQTVFLKKYFNIFDKIIVVSKYCKDVLTSWEFLKDFADKILIIHNYINSTEVKEKSNEQININLSNNLNLVTVARFAPVKRYDRVKKLCDQLLLKNVDYKYFIIGDYNNYENEYGKLVLDMFKDNKNVVLLGAKSNPYPYIKACNYSVVLSERETWSLVISESKILGVPCICSNFESAKEQITDSINGIVLYNDSEKAYYDRIDDILNKKDLLKKNLSNFYYNNGQILNAWNKLL